jgi:hypothetical protein
MTPPHCEDPRPLALLLRRQFHLSAQRERSSETVPARCRRQRQPASEKGIAVYPDDIGPRLPVLGLRALTQNQLDVAIDPERMRVNLRSPDCDTKILGWLVPSTIAVIF